MPPSPSGGSCLRPGASISGRTLLTLLAVSRMAVWDGFGQMNNDGPVVAPQISRCTSIPFSNTSMFLPLRLWPLSGSQRLETQRLRVIVLVGVRATTLRRCFRTKTLTMTWGAWSISLLRRNLAVLRSSEYIKHERKGSRNQRSKESCDEGLHSLVRWRLRTRQPWWDCLIWRNSQRQRGYRPAGGRPLGGKRRGNVEQLGGVCRYNPCVRVLGISLAGARDCPRGFELSWALTRYSPAQ